MDRKQPLKRSPMKRKPPRRGAMDPELRSRVMQRDNYTCQARVVGYALHVVCHRQLHAHHRELVTKVDSMENLVTVCLNHHHHMHNVDRAGAERFGLIVRHAH